MKKVIIKELIKITGVAILLFLCTGLPAQNFQWASHVGGTGGYSLSHSEEERIIDMVTDAEDNLYVLCHIHQGMYDKIRIDGQSINSVSYMLGDIPVDSFLFIQDCILLISYDCSGSLRWYKAFTATDVQYFGTLSWIVEKPVDDGSMDIVNNKIVVAVSSFNGTTLHIREDLHSDTTFTAEQSGFGQGYIDAIMQFDTDGQLEWIRPTYVEFPENSDGNPIYVPQYHFYPLNMTHDSENNIHLLGMIWLFPYDVPPDSINPGFQIIDSITAYVLKYSPSGELLSSVPIGNGTGGESFFYRNNSYYFLSESLTYIRDSVTGIMHPYAIIYNDTIELDDDWPLFLVNIDTLGNLNSYKLLSSRLIFSAAKMDIHNNIYILGGANSYDNIMAPLGRAGCLVKIDILGNTLLVNFNTSYAIANCHVLSDTLVAVNSYIHGSAEAIERCRFDSINVYVEGKAGIYIALLNQQTNKYVSVVRNEFVALQQSAVDHHLTGDSHGNLYVAGQFRDNQFPLGDSVFNIYGDSDRDLYIARYGWGCGEQAQWQTGETGIAEPPPPTAASDNRLLLYPNPATNELHITNYELREGDKVEILDMFGRVNYELPITSSNMPIPVKHLPAGMYVVRVGEMTGKFVKE